jgi:hypothetical protein
MQQANILAIIYNSYAIIFERLSKYFFITLRISDIYSYGILHAPYMIREGVIVVE